ncbi:MAG: (Fe-S)-binding protein, partial [Desulfobacterales bacterium]|nr:(Fe-S)-binding protein [Desulfobacterales bacterium]
EKITAVSEKTRDINEFVTDTLGVRAAEESAPAQNTVTWHDPCHLKKNLGIYKQPRTILAAAGGLRFIEMKEPDRCCGMGGSFNLEHYELSKKIGQKKLKDISDTGADYVATGCPACMLQIIDLLSHAGHNAEVKHAIELYAGALDKRSEKKSR